MTSSTLFYTGSTTKAFTASALAMMIDSGNYSALSPRGFKTPISSIIPDDFVLEDSWMTAHLTLEDALSHRTGYARHDKAIAKRYPDDDDLASLHDVTPRDLTRIIRHLPQVLEPRTEFRYCNLMYIVAAHVIETLTGGSWLGHVLRDWIWAPLGMEDTYLELEDALEGEKQGGPPVASGYWWDYPAEAGQGQDAAADATERHLRWFHHVRTQPSLGLSGAGGIISNVLDYAKWIRCLLGEAAPLPPSAHTAIKTPRMVQDPETRAGFDAAPTYALGWMVSTYRGHTVISHGGGMEAYGSEVYFFPDLNYGVVTMANTAITSNAIGTVVTWELINNKLGVPEKERWDWAGQ